MVTPAAGMPSAQFSAADGLKKNPQPDLYLSAAALENASEFSAVNKEK